MIHCNFRQAGTATGRLSAEQPNLQNVPKRGEDKSKYPVRKAFIPREGKKFVMIDYDQMEYRLLLDIAGEHSVISKILNEGLCVHEATAEMMLVERDPAKTLNFMLLYGGGADKLAAALGITVPKAKSLKNKYFTTLRKVQALVSAIKQVSENRGWLVNWFGRRIICESRNLSYKMPNHYIQGGCGDAAKIAMNNIDDLIIKTPIDMILTVHDEMIFEVNDEIELSSFKQLATIMEGAYPHKTLPLTSGIDFSLTDWHNKEAYNV